MKDKQIAKVEIASKQMPNAEITIEYNINITNNGETDEYITNIRDIPSEGELVQEDSNWSVEGENLINNSLAGEPIKAGETKTLKLKLKTTVDDEGTAKTINNKVEAMENNNADNVSNINTDKATAQLLVGIKTGGIYIAITVTIILIGILVAVAYVMYKKKGVK